MDVFHSILWLIFIYPNRYMNKLRGNESFIDTYDISHWYSSGGMCAGIICCRVISVRSRSAIHLHIYWWSNYPEIWSVQFLVFWHICHWILLTVAFSFSVDYNIHIHLYIGFICNIETKGCCGGQRSRILDPSANYVSNELRDWSYQCRLD